MLIMRIFRIYLLFILCTIPASVNIIHKLLSDIFAYSKKGGQSMTFGEKLRRARREKGLTQAELANQAGLGLRTIIAYEKGETYPQKRKPRPARRRCPALSGRTASAGTRNCSQMAPPGRAILPTKHTARRWHNRPMRTPCAITINRPDQSCRKSRYAPPW